MSVTSTSAAEYRILQIRAPGLPEENCGVMLVDKDSDRIEFQFRQDWEEIAGEDADIISSIAEDLPEKAREMGREGFLAWLDETLSNTFAVLPARTTILGNFERTLHSLYRKHVQATVMQFRTHLPFYPLEACAGGFGKENIDAAEEWVEARIPGRRGLSEDFFLVRIHGRSMEPDIPNGSLCVFRWYHGGSRQGRIMLVEEHGDSEGSGRVTVKRFFREAKEVDGRLERGHITMHPDNQDEYADWDLRKTEEDRYRTIAEFVCVLEDPPAR